MALAYIGKDGFAALMGVLSDPKATNRSTVATCIGGMRGIGTNAEQAVPLLVEALSGKDSRLATTAAMALGELHLDAAVAVPALTNCLSSSDPRMRSLAVTSLQFFGPEAGSAAPALAAMLGDPDYWVRLAATNALRAVSPGAVQGRGVGGVH